MRRGGSAAMKRRLDVLERRRGRGGLRGFMLVPKRLPMGEWTRLASDSQAILKKHMKGDEDGPPAYSEEYKKLWQMFGEFIKCKVKM